ncbi:ubiquitin carboxyl-terminal hydrolase 8-like [Montipora capricornis]|uniref:ubiquitin carboxyl-terminal hydrolase 8-like n=1 Tax=Montipora foliosa TaxID=591990 RepID=UPI0035F20782
MSMATNYRYEVERPGTKNLRKALKRQEERIKNDELNSEQEAKVKSEIRVNQISEWMEKQEENSEKRLLKQWAEDTKDELSLANKELTAVRKAQLRKLLYTEQSLYEMELNNQGKSFYMQRT